MHAVMENPIEPLFEYLSKETGFVIDQVKLMQIVCRLETRFFLVYSDSLHGFDVFEFSDGIGSVLCAASRPHPLVRTLPVLHCYGCNPGPLLFWLATDGGSPGRHRHQLPAHSAGPTSVHADVCVCVCVCVW